MPTRDRPLDYTLYMVFKKNKKKYTVHYLNQLVCFREIFKFGSYNCIWNKKSNNPFIICCCLNNTNARNKFDNCDSLLKV
ncbi:hypothetical protein HanIR_Chr05g0245411 [Helianthus annuus]|nr:hypothetical protein HanIR_Chr05g0245411 [Helianthus annuus]